MLPQITVPKRITVFLCLALFSGLALSAAATDIESLLEQGKNQEALAASDTFLANDATDKSVRFSRGVALARLGKADAAVDVFGNLARENPEVPEYANNLAVLYAQKGEYEKARRWLEAAMSTHPAYATAHRNLGDVYTALAAVAYSKALDQQGQPTDLGVQLELVPKLYDGPGAPTTIAQAPAQTSTPRVVEAPKPAPEPAYPPTGSEPQPAPESAPQPTPTPEPAAPAEPAPAQQPAEAVPAPAAPTETAQATKAEIMQAVRSWATVWANQNVDGYLNSYADNFYPGDDQTLAQWRATRRDRVSSPTNIQVEVIDSKVNVDRDGRARVVFRQNYDADSYSDSVGKILIMERNAAGEWKIVRETSAPL